MARRKKSNDTPTPAPTKKPTRKAARVSTAPLTVTPIRRSARRSIVESTRAPQSDPENTVYLAYELIDFESHRKCHPNFYGECLGEFITAADAKNSLRDHERYGAFAIVERVNGKIGRSWPIEIDPPDDASADDDYSLLDPDEFDDEALSNPKIMRAELKAARFKAERDALREHRSHNGHDPLAAKIIEQALPRILNPPSTVEQVRDARELIDTFTPRREPNPAPAPQPQRSEEEILLSAIATNPDVMEKVIGGISRKFISGESANDPEPWYGDIVRKAVENGQAAQIIAAIAAPLGNGLGNLLSSISSMIAPKPAQTPAQQAPQTPQAPAIQAQQQTQPAPQVAPAETPALPANDQQPQGAQPQIEQGPMQMAPIDALVYHLIQLCEKQAPVGEAVTLINVSVVRNPELGDSIDELLDLPTDQILALLSAYHSPVAQMPHAKTWLESLMNALTAEGGNGDFDEVTEIGEGSVKL